MTEKITQGKETAAALRLTRFWTLAAVISILAVPAGLYFDVPVLTAVGGIGAVVFGVSAGVTGEEVLASQERAKA